jgi:hypothetical protein
LSINHASAKSKEVDYERFTSFNNLAGLSPCPFEKNTVWAYEFTIAKFNQNFVDLNLNEVSTDDILVFMTQITEGRKP